MGLHPLTFENRKKNKIRFNLSKFFYLQQVGVWPRLSLDKFRNVKKCQINFTKRSSSMQKPLFETSARLLSKNVRSIELKESDNDFQKVTKRSTPFRPHRGGGRGGWPPLERGWDTVVQNASKEEGKKRKREEETKHFSFHCRRKHLKIFRRENSQVPTQLVQYSGT